MSPRPIEAPVETHEANGRVEGEVVASHPAFAQIVANRTSGDINLYGSDFTHHGYITINIRRSKLRRSLAHDWFHGGEELIQVALSEAQWARFVSTPNVGEGPPCTILYLGRETVPGLPLRRAIDAFRDEAIDTLTRAAARVRQAINSITEKTAGLSQAKRAAIVEDLHQLRRDLDDRLPFVAKSLSEHMETTVEKARVEVNAYTMNAINRAGLKALGIDDAAPIRLGAGPLPVDENGCPTRADGACISEGPCIHSPPDGVSP